MDTTTLQKRLRAVRESWPEIAKRTGVSIHTIRKIAYGDRKNPSMRIVGPLLGDAEVMGEKEAA